MFIYGYVHDIAVAEDLAADTFVRALRGIHSVTYLGRPPIAWLHTIARNIALDWLKSSARRTHPIADLADITDWRPFHLGTLPEQTETRFRRAEDDRILHGYISRLNPDQARVIRLRFLDGLSVAETADTMGRNEGAVKALQHRAVKSLARLMAADGYGSRAEWGLGAVA